MYTILGPVHQPLYQQLIHQCVDEAVLLEYYLNLPQIFKKFISINYIFENLKLVNMTLGLLRWSCVLSWHFIRCIKL